MLCLLAVTRYKMVKTGIRQHKRFIICNIITDMKIKKTSFNIVNFGLFSFLGFSIIGGGLFSNITASVAAENVRYYDFEIIIFESLNEEARNSEAWKNNFTIEVPETLVRLGKPYPGPMPKEYNPRHTFKRLPKKSYRLIEEAKLLKENDQYRVLMHTAWRQPGMTAETTLPILLHKEYIVTQKAPEVPAETDPDMPSVNLPVPTTAVTGTQSKAILDGYLKIVLSRYLHANFNLTYKTGLPLKPESSAIVDRDDYDGGKSAEPVVITYQLQQTRKMRSKEVHYIDHPVIGIVMIAWPYKGKDVR